jgi:hemoglobin-like flavoprotein
MTPDQIRLVQTSFSQLAPDADKVAALFYHRLFSQVPSLRPLFKNDMPEQGRKLMNMLAMIVRSLSAPGGLVPVLSEMGRRHHGYGVEDWHYGVVGDALLWTLGSRLGERFTPDIAAAWGEAFRLLSGCMIEGARRGASAAA